MDYSSLNHEFFAKLPPYNEALKNQIKSVQAKVTGGSEKTFGLVFDLMESCLMQDYSEAMAKARRLWKTTKCLPHDQAVVLREVARRHEANRSVFEYLKRRTMEEYAKEFQS
jgi:hypothetical protein